MVEVLINEQYQLAEGPLWDEREHVLYWVDITAGNIHRYDPQAKAHDVYSIGESVGTVALRESGGMIVAIESGFATFDLENESLQAIVDPEATKTGNRFNDGKAAPDGSFWAGSMSYKVEEGAGGLYRLKPDGDVQQFVENVTISNGLAWSSDHKTMYYIDTIPRKVYAFDYDTENAAISNRRTIIDVLEGLGSPDGMTIDTEDKLWIAHYGGRCVRRWDPETGKILEEIPVPADNVTCCVFGGADFKRLYITTAAQGLDEKQLAEQPLAGAIFYIDLPYQGRPAFRFGG